MPYYGSKHTTPFSSRLDRDALMMANREYVSEVAFRVLDGINQEAPHNAIAAIAVCMAAFCERVAMDPSEIYAVGSKLLRTKTLHGTSMGEHRLDALQDFAKLRFRSDENLLRSNNRG